MIAIVVVGFCFVPPMTADVVVAKFFVPLLKAVVVAIFSVPPMTIIVAVGILVCSSLDSYCCCRNIVRFLT